MYKPPSMPVDKSTKSLMICDRPTFSRCSLYKFPGRQKIIISCKWGLANVNRENYSQLRGEACPPKCHAAAYLYTM
jgi:hypothetical protein